MFDKDLTLKIFKRITSCENWQSLDVNGIIYAIDIWMEVEGYLKTYDQLYLFAAVQYAQRNGIENAINEYFGDES